MKHRLRSELITLGLLLLTFLLINPSGVEAGGGTSYPNGYVSW